MWSHDCFLLKRIILLLKYHPSSGGALAHHLQHCNTCKTKNGQFLNMADVLILDYRALRTKNAKIVFWSKHPLCHKRMWGRKNGKIRWWFTNFVSCLMPQWQPTARANTLCLLYWLLIWIRPHFDNCHTLLHNRFSADIFMDHMTFFLIEQRNNPYRVLQNR